MEDQAELQERLRRQRPVDWDQLPDFSLYMDQVLSYMDRQVLRFDGDDGLTAAMVNNYTKGGLLPRADGKKYSREHLAYLTVICVLKQVLSTRDMHLLLDQELKDSGSVEAGYQTFCRSLDGSMNLTADQMDRHQDPEKLADSAIHFALLSYAAGAASRRYVTLLRRQRDAGEEKPAREKRVRQKKEEESD
ncbi:hypothetical protein SDC9_73724 [bioreactor metagenome]|uniref:DUF1836 domain-containing protein n=1 Tax=bioreactor metagenome TaxID=1076179 RepID=A0A644YM84_9ZZZZ